MSQPIELVNLTDLPIRINWLFFECFFDIGTALDLGPVIHLCLKSKVKGHK